MDNKEPIFFETFRPRPTLFYGFFTLVCVIYLSELLLDPSVKDFFIRPAFPPSLFLFIGLMLLVLWALYTWGSGNIIVEYFADRITVTYRKQQRTIPLKDITKVWIGRYRSGRDRFFSRRTHYNHFVEAFPGSIPGTVNDWRWREQKGEALVWNLDVMQLAHGVGGWVEWFSLNLIKTPRSQEFLRTAFPHFLILQPRSDAKPCMLRTQDTKKVLEYLRTYASKATFSPLIDG